MPFTQSFHRLGVAASLAGALLAIPVGQAQAGTIEEISESSPVSSFGSRAAWSKVTDSSFAFTVYRDGATSQPAISGRSIPFDVDLGPDDSDGAQAVYSRCETEPSGGYSKQYNWKGASGCRLYRYSFSSNKESRIKAIAKSGYSDVAPTVWENKVAFVRMKDGGKSPKVYYQSTKSGSSPHKLPVPSASAYDSLDLYGSRYAVALEREEGGESPTYEIRLGELEGSKPKLVEDQTGGNLTGKFLAWPNFSSGYLNYARLCFGDPSGCTQKSRQLVRYKLSSGKLSSADSPGYLVGQTRAGDTTYYVEAATDYGSDSSNVCTNMDADEGPLTPCTVASTSSLDY